MVGKRIADGRELDVLVGIERLASGPAPASAATDQTYLNDVIARGMHRARRRERTQQGGSNTGSGAGAQKGAARRTGSCGFRLAGVGHGFFLTRGGVPAVSGTIGGS